MQVITTHFASNCPSANVGRWEEVCYLMPQLTASGPPMCSASPNQLAFESDISLWKWVSSICWALWFSVPVYLLYIVSRPSCLMPPSILQLLIHITPTLPQLITTKIVSISEVLCLTNPGCIITLDVPSDVSLKIPAIFNMILYKSPKVKVKSR